MVASHRHAKMLDARAFVMRGSGVQVSSTAPSFQKLSGKNYFGLYHVCRMFGVYEQNLAILWPHAYRQRLRCWES